MLMSGYSLDEFEIWKCKPQLISFAEMIASADRSFNRIDQRIRGTLRSKRFPMVS